MNTVVTCHNEIDSLFDSKIESATRGLRPDATRYLQSISIPNALFIIDYITSMRTEINLSDNYRRDLIILLCRFSGTNHHKPFEQITRVEVISFLDSFRKAEETDSLHKWIGTYNLYRTSADKMKKSVLKIVRNYVRLHRGEFNRILETA